MRSFFRLAAAAAALLPIAAQAQQASPKADDDTIVVTGVPLWETEKALKDCLARHCPPDEDIRVTLAHAENQFVAGDYKHARETLLASRGRNQKYAAQYPVPVSDLLRANSRVAAHLGEGEAYRVGALDVVAALKAGLSEDDPRVLVARVEVADSLFRFGRFKTAEQRYWDVVRDARRLKLPVVEGFALLRIASLYARLAEYDPANYGRSADKALDRVINSPVPEHRPYANAARVLKVRLAAKRGDDSAVDRVLADFRADPTERPVLLFSTPVELPDESGRAGNDGSVTQRIATNPAEDQWVDVSFWVAPDGHPTDVAVLRESKRLDDFWVKPVLASIEARRYAPLKRDPTDPGVLRVERYTYTARWTRQTGSRLRVRETQPRIEMLDLSAEPAGPVGTEGAKTR